MTEQQSILPSVEEVREEQTMKIITVSTLGLERERVKTTLTRTNKSLEISSVPIFTTLIRIDDEQVKEYMPSKVWCDDSLDIEDMGARNFNILFYVNSTMPKIVRPFKTNTYFMYFVPERGDIIEYDVNIRLFMDQVHTKHAGLIYVVMFGEDEYAQIVDKGQIITKSVPLNADEEAILQQYKEGK